MCNCFRAYIAFLMSVVSMLFTPVTILPEIQETENVKTQEITVMNFNLYIAGIGDLSPDNRVDEVVQVIKTYNPDSFGVEEADEKWLNRLSNALPEYSYVGNGRNKDLSGEASAIFYLREKYDLIKTETFWLSKTPNVPSRGWDAWINRVCTIAVLKDKITDFNYAHFNAHFDNSGAISRIEAVSLVSEKASKFNMPIVFTGDLNAKEGSFMYNRILEAGFKDTKYLANKSDNGATYHGYIGLNKVNNKPIDFIFVNSYCDKVEYYKIDSEKYNNILPSDHYPVISKMVLFC